MWNDPLKCKPLGWYQTWVGKECHYTYAAGRSTTVHRLSHPPTLFMHNDTTHSETHTTQTQESPKKAHSQHFFLSLARGWTLQCSSTNILKLLTVSQWVQLSAAKRSFKGGQLKTWAYTRSICAEKTVAACLRWGNTDICLKAVTAGTAGQEVMVLS